MARKRSKAPPKKGRNLASRMREPGQFKPRSVRKAKKVR